MRIAATSVSMDAAGRNRDVENRVFGVSSMPDSVPRADGSDDFSARLISRISSTTRWACCSQAVVRSGEGEPSMPPPPSVVKDNTEEQAAALSELAEGIIGQPVTIQPLLPEREEAPGGDPLARRVGGMVVSGSLTVYREERSFFSAQGMAQTTDGRDIAFSLAMAMERRSLTHNAISWGVMPGLIDPLVLNFGDQPPLLADSTFLFDLDADGRNDRLPCLGQGCGFLVFDKNDDGIANNGLELFGPASGSGFGELAALDSDSNLWIDENDPIFDRLRIWSGGQGDRSLLSLREAGVGAISIIQAGTAFRLEDSAGGMLGAVKASGLFLMENGDVRSLQEIDLADQDAHSPAGIASAVLGDEPAEGALAAMRIIIALQRMRLQIVMNRFRLGALPAEASKHWQEEADRILQPNLAQFETGRLEIPADNGTVSSRERSSMFRYFFGMLEGAERNSFLQHGKTEGTASTGV